MVNLTFYGGVNEIGGNKILLEDNDTRILMDFGMSFNQYYWLDLLYRRRGLYRISKRGYARLE
jgi:ribonuclease J